MAKTEYIRRICDEELAFQLECAGAVVVQGPKWCGKTRTSEEMARKELSGDESFTFLAKPYSLGDLTQKVFEVLNDSDK